MERDIVLFYLLRGLVESLVVNERVWRGRREGTKEKREAFFNVSTINAMVITIIIIIIIISGKSFNFLKQFETVIFVGLVAIPFEYPYLFRAKFNCRNVSNGDETSFRPYIHSFQSREIRNKRKGGGGEKRLPAVFRVR